MLAVLSTFMEIGLSVFCVFVFAMSQVASVHISWLEIVGLVRRVVMSMLRVKAPLHLRPSVRLDKNLHDSHPCSHRVVIDCECVSLWTLNSSGVCDASQPYSACDHNDVILSVRLCIVYHLFICTFDITLVIFVKKS